MTVRRDSITWAWLIWVAISQLWVGLIITIDPIIISRDRYNLIQGAHPTIIAAAFLISGAAAVLAVCTQSHRWTVAALSSHMFLLLWPALSLFDKTLRDFDIGGAEITPWVFSGVLVSGFVLAKGD